MAIGTPLFSLLFAGKIQRAVRRAAAVAARWSEDRRPVRASSTPVLGSVWRISTHHFDHRLGREIISGAYFDNMQMWRYREQNQKLVRD
jgi:hypothetical protein